MGIASDLQKQWSVPADILSLLLLIGGDIIQKAIAQLVGYVITVPGKRCLRLQITPVAFSFGWAAYSFANLLAAVGDMRLMPPADTPTLTVNCSNGFARETRSWVLGRVLRDHKIRYPTNRVSTARAGRRQSIRIDIFYLDPVTHASTDFVWWSGWATLVLQIGIAIIPGGVHGAWEALLITACGAGLVAVTCAMPQWSEEKWAARKLERQKVTCLTQGNGGSHILVLIGLPGAWDLESLSTGDSEPRPETRWLSLILAVLWICLLITMAGVKEHTWYLVAIGGLGMLQNVLAAGAAREPAAFGLQLKSYTPAPVIIGYPGSTLDVSDDHIDFSRHETELSELDSWASNSADRSSTEETAPKMPNWVRTMAKEDGVPGWLASSPAEPHLHNHVRSGFSWSSSAQSEPLPVREGIGVHGALMELEKWVPSAGLAMMQIFFPGGLKYNDEAVRDNFHKRFWKLAYHTEHRRRKAAEKFRAEQDATEPSQDATA